MATKKKMLQAAAGSAAGGGGFTAIEDVFSTYLYTGDGVSASDYVVNNGIDLQNEGGLVWIKRRDIAENHALTHTDQSLNVNGFYPYLQSQSTSAAASSDAYGINAFTDTGFTMRGRSGPTDNEFNSVNSKMASWTFRKAPRFFDVVTYTGTGSARTIAHNLGTDVGTIIVKRTDSTSDWSVWHRGYGGAGGVLNLNELWAGFTGQNHWNSTLPTSTEFSLGAVNAVNTSGGIYVAYLFAHDPLGPSEDGSDGLIACGSFTVDGSAQATVELGWEPQWILVKASNTTGGWLLLDTMRGYANPSGSRYLFANLSGAESSPGSFGYPTATGFFATGLTNAGNTMTYIAIRRGPMRAPESGTEVFAVDDQSRVSDGVAPRFRGGFVADFLLWKEKTTATDWAAASRMTGQGVLATNTTASEVTSSFYKWDFMNGVLNVTSTDPNKPAWLFRRAPNFFDVVAYTGDGVAGRTVPHNLGVAPELMIVKARSQPYFWAVWASAFPITQRLQLNEANALAAQNIFETLPTDSVFYLSNETASNRSGDSFIAYLFATLAGVSKVGSYTGNGSSQTIDCGFTSGARFVLIKRTDSTGDWYIWDTARGIVAGNDPHLSLNTTAAQVTTKDSIDPDSSGFIVNQVAATNINVSSASYIFYAIA